MPDKSPSRRKKIRNGRSHVPLCAIIGRPGNDVAEETEGLSSRWPGIASRSYE